MTARRLWRIEITAPSYHADWGRGPPSHRAVLAPWLLHQMEFSGPQVWRRCHRRIIADYLLASGARVEHIMGRGQVVPATLTPGARVMGDGKLRYPATEDVALPGSDGL